MQSTTSEGLRLLDLARSFLEEIDASIGEDLAIHVVLDNGSSHTSKATKAWFAQHPRFVVHHTPVHAS